MLTKTASMPTIVAAPIRAQAQVGDVSLWHMLQRSGVVPPNSMLDPKVAVPPTREGVASADSGDNFMGIACAAGKDCGACGRGGPKPESGPASRRATRAWRTSILEGKDLLLPQPFEAGGVDGGLAQINRVVHSGRERPHLRQSRPSRRRLSTTTSSAVPSPGSR